MRCLHIADEARRITLRRLLKLVFDIFRQRHSDYRGESRPDLPQSSREEKNEDAAFRCQISLLSLKFRDNSVERTFQASFRAHMDSTVTTARQTLLAFVLFGVVSAPVIQNLKRIGAQFLYDYSDNVRRKGLCIGSCFTILDVSGMLLLVVYKYISNYNRVMQSSHRFLLFIVAFGLLASYFIHALLSGMYADTSFIVQKRDISILMRDARPHEVDFVHDKNLHFLNNLPMLAMLLDELLYYMDICLEQYSDDGVDTTINSPEEVDTESCTAAIHQTTFMAYGVVGMHNKVLENIFLLLLIYFATEFILGGHFYPSYTEVAIIFLLISNILFFSTPRQHALITLLELMCFIIIPLCLIVRETSYSSRRQFFSSWQRNLLLEEEAANLSVDSSKTNTALESAKKRFELLTKAPDEVTTFDDSKSPISAHDMSKSVVSEQWTLDSKFGDALARNKYFGAKMDHAFHIDVSKISDLHHLVKCDPSFKIFQGKFEDSEVMVKRLNISPTDDNSMVDTKMARFSAEMNLFGTLNHRNVVAMIGANWKDHLCIVLECPHLGLLCDVVKNDPSYLKKRWHDILHDVANGMHYLQSHHRICHTNISMSCIFVDQNGLYSIGELQDSVQYLGDGESHFPGGNGAHNIDAAHINDLLHVAPEVHVMGRVSSTCDSFSFGMLAVALCVAPTSLRDFIEKMHAEHLDE